MERDFIGKNFIFLSETLSTNSYASELLRKVKLAEGTVVFTHHQTQGRGRRTNAWKADPVSNLTLSIVLIPDFLPIDKYFYLSKISALACYDALTEIILNSQDDIKIKWPNDIFVNKEKIGGILIENTLSGNQINSSIVGIGINVNQSSFSKELNATSLINIVNHKVDVMQLLNKICAYLESYYLSLRKSNFEEIDIKYLSKLLGLNKTLNYNYNGNEMQLKISGISNAGLLQLYDEQNNLIEADLNELKLL